MTSRNRIWWEVVKSTRFDSDFLELDGRGQWTVDKTLDGMVRCKDPVEVYDGIACDDCMHDTWLFGVQDDGSGNKGLKLQIYINRDRQVLYPVGVWPTEPSDEL